MTNRKLLPVLGAIVLSSSAYGANDSNIDIDLSDQVLRLAYEGPFRNTDLNTNFSYLHHEGGANAISAGVNVTGLSKASSGGQKTGIGAKFVAFDADGFNGGSIALGGYFRHTLATANLISLRADAYYSPSVVSFGDTDKYWEFSFRMEYTIMDNASVFAGWRNMEVDAQVDYYSADVELQQGGFLGLSLLF